MPEAGNVRVGFRRRDTETKKFNLDGVENDEDSQRCDASSRMRKFKS